MIVAPPKTLPIIGPDGGQHWDDFWFYAWPDGHYGGCQPDNVNYRLRLNQEYVKNHKKWDCVKPLYAIVVRLKYKSFEKIY